jgi:hypothetical protein
MEEGIIYRLNKEDIKKMMEYGVIPKGEIKGIWELTYFPKLEKKEGI